MGIQSRRLRLVLRRSAHREQCERQKFGSRCCLDPVVSLGQNCLLGYFWRRDFWSPKSSAVRGGDLLVPPRPISRVQIYLKYSLRHRLATVAFLSLALAGIGLLLMTLAQERGLTASHADKPAARAAEMLVEMFGPSERLPSSLADRLRSAMNGRSAIPRLDGSQRLETREGTVWLANGRDAGQAVTCMVMERSGALSCGKMATFLRHGLVLGTAMSSEWDRDVPRDFHLLGVAPDWVKAVEVSVGGTVTRRLPVREHFYASRAAVPIFLKQFCASRHGECQRPDGTRRPT